MHVSLLLIRPVVRAIDWTPLLVACAVTLGLALIMAPTPYIASLVLRMSGLLLGAAAAFALVDPMAGSAGATPVPRWLRQWLRTVLAMGLAALAWGAALEIAAVRVPSTLPRAGLVLEAAVTLMVSLAAAAVAVRRLPGRPAAFSGVVAQLATAAVVIAVLRQNQPWPLIGEPRWDQAHRGWLLALPVPVLLLAIANADPLVLRRRMVARRWPR
jgi:hypothetical protein